MPSKCPRSIIAQFEHFTNLNLLEYAFNVIQNWETMVHKSLEKSLKIEKLMDILEKSLNFPQKSLNVLESSLNKNSLH